MRCLFHTENLFDSKLVEVKFTELHLGARCTTMKCLFWKFQSISTNRISLIITSF
jgi:hypothetical protein